MKFYCDVSQADSVVLDHRLDNGPGTSLTSPRFGVVMFSVILAMSLSHDHVSVL